jgi:hypothetical protein
MGREIAVLGRLAFLWVLPLTLSASAVAQDSQYKALTILTGECRFQVIQGFIPCQANVMWLELRNGRAIVSFFKDDTAFSLSGGRDRQPNPEDYYQSIDTVRVVRKGKPDENGEVEGECHFRLNRSASKFYFIRCDVYNRAAGFAWKFYLENIKSFERKIFPSGKDETNNSGVSSIERLASGAPILVPLQKEHGIYVVPVLINNAITLKFVIDSGASDVSIPADVVMTLTRTGTLQDSDFIGTQTYRLDGSTVPSTTFRIRSLTVRTSVIEGVTGSVAPVAGDLLLGQSFLSRFKSWSIDNDRRRNTSSRLS